MPDLPALPVIDSIADARLERVLRSKIAHKFKPVGGLGRLEELALQLGLIQRDDVIALRDPQCLIFAADHGVAVEGVWDFDQSVTHHVVRNILAGGAAVSVLARQHNIALRLVDAGVASELDNHPLLVRRKIAFGTRNMVMASAMSDRQLETALQCGMDVARDTPGNVLLLANVGVSVAASAAMLLVRLGGHRIADAAAGGSGWDEARVRREREVLLRASLRHKNAQEPLAAMAAFGGLEIAMLVGAMLQGASERRVLMIDGYVCTMAAMVACALVPAARDYMVFSQLGAEAGHALALRHLDALPLLDLGVRMGEGVGAMMAWPTLQFTARFMNEMASYESAGVPYPRIKAGEPGGPGSPGNAGN